MKIQKYKIILATSLTLIGGGALLSSSLLMTSCNNSKIKNSNPLKTMGIEITDWNLNNRSIANWAQTPTVAIVDYSNFKMPKNAIEFFISSNRSIITDANDGKKIDTFYINFVGESNYNLPGKQMFPLLAFSTAGVAQGTYNFFISFEVHIVFDDNHTASLFDTSPSFIFNRINIIA